MDDLRTFLTGVAVFVSLWALWWSWRGWKETYRPIVTVHVESLGSTTGLIRYHLVVLNSGNRPALNIRLSTDIAKLEQCLEPAAVGRPVQSKLLAHAKRCFSGFATIPLLAPGARALNSFGWTGVGEDGHFWTNQSTFFVEVAYADIVSREYRHRILCEIRDTLGFGGGIWGDSKP